MRTKFIGIAEKYKDDYELGYKDMMDRMDKIGLSAAIRFYNEKYPHKKGHYLGLKQFFTSEGEIDALTDNLSRKD